MSIISVSPDSRYIRHPSFHNVYPILDEIHGSTDIASRKVSRGEWIIDDAYGRVFTLCYSDEAGLYGKSGALSFYAQSKKLRVVDELRVPYRRVPVFEVDSPDQIKEVVARQAARTDGYNYLLRGQTRNYLLSRSEEDSLLLYGSKCVNEPSLTASYLRCDFDAHFVQAMWIGMTDIVVHDLALDYVEALGEGARANFMGRVEEMRRMPSYVGFALGLAQHYGLPSVGLDLTDSVFVASWFASNTISVKGKKLATASPVASRTDECSPVIFLLRCPSRVVFEYTAVRPDLFPVGRPDMQCAWFGHAGWGLATNQLAGFVICAFQLSDTYLSGKHFPRSHELFPGAEEDRILDVLIKLREKPLYEGEARRALERVYTFG